MSYAVSYTVPDVLGYRTVIESSCHRITTNKQKRIGSRTQKPIQTRPSEKGIDYKEKWEVLWDPVAGNTAKLKRS